MTLGCPKYFEYFCYFSAIDLEIFLGFHLAESVESLSSISYRITFNWYKGGGSKMANSALDSGSKDPGFKS